MSPWRVLYLSATTHGVPRRAFSVALIVGTILNLINQGDVIFGGDGAVNWFKISLTFFVPYAVSTHAAVCTHLHASKMLVARR